MPRVALAFAIGAGSGLLWAGWTKQPPVEARSAAAVTTPSVAVANPPANAASKGAAEAATPSDRRVVADAEEAAGADSASETAGIAAKEPPDEIAPEPEAASPGTESSQAALPTSVPMPAPRPALALTSPKKAQARRSGRTQQRDAAASAPPGLRYVGTRTMPDGSRVPVYRREAYRHPRRAFGYAEEGGRGLFGHYGPSWFAADED